MRTPSTVQPARQRRADDIPIPEPSNWSRMRGQDAALAKGRLIDNTLAALRTMRTLLQPSPVTVEICTDPRHPRCLASIVVGADPRTDGPVYSLHLPQQPPLLLTHAQLCALTVAGNQIVKSSAAGSDGTSPPGVGQ